MKLMLLLEQLRAINALRKIIPKNFTHIGNSYKDIDVETKFIRESWINTFTIWFNIKSGYKRDLTNFHGPEKRWTDLTSSNFVHYFHATYKNRIKYIVPPDSQIKIQITSNHIPTPTIDKYYWFTYDPNNEKNQIYIEL